MIRKKLIFTISKFMFSIVLNIENYGQVVRLIESI